MKPSKWIQEMYQELTMMNRDIDVDAAYISAIVEYLDMKYEEEHDS